MGNRPGPTSHVPNLQPADDPCRAGGYMCTQPNTNTNTYTTKY